MKKNDIDIMETVMTLLLFAIVVGGPIIYGEIKTKRLLEKDAKRQQFDAYIQTLPNYDDSIRLATTQEELERALALREQQRLKIAHFRDSLYNVEKR